MPLNITINNLPEKAHQLCIQSHCIMLDTSYKLQVVENSITFNSIQHMYDVKLLKYLKVTIDEIQNELSVAKQVKNIKYVHINWDYEQQMYAVCELYLKTHPCLQMALLGTGDKELINCSENVVFKIHICFA